MHRAAFLAFFSLLIGCSSTASDDAPTTTIPPAADVPPAGNPPPAPPCSGKPGTFHDQAFPSDGETRHYWLHVPASYDCSKPAALVVDFHGTGFGGATDPVEESWATPDLISASDDLGFIVVRPRSRMKAAEQDGAFYYQWDINPGDVPKNKAFALALVADLLTKYHVDNARIYATGFSNGPSMAAQFLADEPSTFKGFGLIAGGLNAPLARKSNFAANAPRVYTMTGFRDYMLVAKDILESFLDAHQHPLSARFDREADTGHEVYGWHFREAFAWMDRGERPDAGKLRSPWIAETTGTDETLIEMTADPSGAIVAVGAKGGVYTRASGAWSKTATLPIAPVSDVCFLPDGRGFAVGHGHLATTEDGKTWKQATDIPEFGTKQFGYTYATTIACSAGRVTAGGVWSSATSTDGGKTWSAATIGDAQAPTFVSAVRTSDAGWLALGYYDYVGSSSDGASFVTAGIAGETQWWNDGAISASHGVVVGEGSAVQTSAGAGTPWKSVAAPTHDDLYAVALRGSRAVAVGAHGTVIVSDDGGATWTDRSTGLDAMLGAVRFLDDTTVLVAGQKGNALRLSL